MLFLRQTFRIGQPFGGLAVAVKLLFPNRYFGFYGIDDKAAGGEGGVAVAGGNAHPNRHIAHFQAAVAVYADGVFNRKLLFGGSDDRFALFAGEFFIGAVHQIIDALAVILAAYPTFKRSKGAALFVVEQRLAQLGGIDGLFGDVKPGSTSGNGGDKGHNILISERGVPWAEAVVYGGTQAALRQGESMALGQQGI